MIYFGFNGSVNKFNQLI